MGISAAHGAWLLGVGLVAAPAPFLLHAQVAEVNRGAPQAYEIAPQALQSALEAYGATSGVQVIYDSALAQDRRSPGVRGQHTPETALAALLADTGLASQFVRSSAVYIYAPGSGSSSAPAGEMASGAVLSLNTLRVEAPPVTIGRPRFDGYAPLVQAAVRHALEQTSAVRHGDWAVVARLTLDEKGQVVAAQLEGSTGDAARDRTIQDTIRGVRLTAPPPPGLPQPVRVQLRADGP